MFFARIKKTKVENSCNHYSEQKANKFETSCLRIMMSIGLMMLLHPLELSRKKKIGKKKGGFDTCELSPCKAKPFSSLKYSKR